MHWIAPTVRHFPQAHLVWKIGSFCHKLVMLMMVIACCAFKMISRTNRSAVLTDPEPCFKCVCCRHIFRVKPRKLWPN